MILSLLLAAASAQPQTVLVVDPRHRLIEGVASDGRQIWLSSLVDRQILACRTSCRTLATLPPGLHPFAIAWDNNRQRLWVAADCPPGVSFIKACDRGALLALDRRGRIRSRIASASGSFHPGDVSISPTGVFVSDSQNGAIYRLGADQRSLQSVVPAGVGRSAQGSAASADGETLLVADYSQGIGSIDLATGARSLLARQDGKPLRGIDGLIRCGANYYGIYNGAAPGRLMSIRRSAAGIEVGELGNGLSLPDPTQIASDGKRLLIVADSGWTTIDTPGFKRISGAPVIAIPLPPDCKPK